MAINYVLFDAANTLIYKPELFKNYIRILKEHGLNIGIDNLRRHHKIVSELVKFPERTSEEFYHSFNSEVLFSLGIIPYEKLLKDIFNACTYLKWDKYEDTKFLSEIELPLGVLSNFNNSLNGHIDELFGPLFKEIFVSADIGLSKPAIEFFQHAIDRTGFSANEILYIGDSLKSDIAPGKAAGMHTYLIDRVDLFDGYENRITSLSNLKSILHKF